jgi:hypothetical protein
LLADIFSLIASLSASFIWLGQMMINHVDGLWWWFGYVLDELWRFFMKCWWLLVVLDVAVDARVGVVVIFFHSKAVG